jgi:hypothetical protein
MMTLLKTKNHNATFQLANVDDHTVEDRLLTSRITKKHDISKSVCVCVCVYIYIYILIGEISITLESRDVLVLCGNKKMNLKVN